MEAHSGVYLPNALKVYRQRGFAFNYKMEMKECVRTRSHYSSPADSPALNVTSMKNGKYMLNVNYIKKIEPKVCQKTKISSRISGSRYFRSKCFVCSIQCTVQRRKKSRTGVISSV